VTRLSDQWAGNGSGAMRGSATSAGGGGLVCRQVVGCRSNGGPDWVHYRGVGLRSLPPEAPLSACAREGRESVQPGPELAR
jgi:hypothetical protein